MERVSPVKPPWRAVQQATQAEREKGRKEMKCDDKVEVSFLERAPVSKMGLRNFGKIRVILKVTKIFKDTAVNSGPGLWWAALFTYFSLFFPLLFIYLCLFPF